MSSTRWERQFALVQEALAGAQDAYSRLYELAEPGLRKHLLRMVSETDIDDVVQITMWKAFSHLQDFAGRSAFTTWVISIGRNEALDLRRKLLRGHQVIPVSLGDATTNPDGEKTPLALAGYEDRSFERRTAYETVHRALSALGPVEQIAFTMKIDGYKNAEIAQRLGKTTAAVKTIIFRAKKAMTNNILAQAA